METNDYKITSKNTYKFNCEMCLFNCYKAGDWSRHILTRKHINCNKITSSHVDYTPLMNLLSVKNVIIHINIIPDFQDILKRVVRTK